MGPSSVHSRHVRARLPLGGADQQIAPAAGLELSNLFSGLADPLPHRKILPLSGRFFRLGSGLRSHCACRLPPYAEHKRLSFIGLGDRRPKRSRNGTLFAVRCREAGGNDAGWSGHTTCGGPHGHGATSPWRALLPDPQPQTCRRDPFAEKRAAARGVSFSP